MNDTVCTPTASVIILHASITIPSLDGTSSFGLSTLLPVFWCVILSVVYLMSFPNRLSTTLAAALEKSRAEALGKELSTAKIANINLGSKHQLALDELNKKMKQIVDAQDLTTHAALQDAAEKHAKSTKAMDDEYGAKILAVEQDCEEELKTMHGFYQEKRRNFEDRHHNILEKLRRQISTDSIQHKKVKAVLERTIKQHETTIQEQETCLDQAYDVSNLREKEKLQLGRDVNRLRQSIESQKKQSLTMLAEKERTITKLTDKLQQAASQDSVDERNWASMEQQIFKLEKEHALTRAKLRGTETHIEILENQLRDMCKKYVAAKSEVEQQAKAASAYATRAILKLKRLRKVMARNSKNNGSTPKVEGQVMAQEAANINDHSKRLEMHAQATAQSIPNPGMAPVQEAKQLKRTTRALKTVEAELKTCRASLAASKSELKKLRETWRREHSEYLRTRANIDVAEQILDSTKQHNEQLAAQLEAARQGLRRKRTSDLQVRLKISQLELELQICKCHGKASNRKVKRSREAAAVSATTRVSELNLVLNKVNDELRVKDDENAALQQQIHEHTVKSSNSNSNQAFKESMELECEIEDAPVEWEDVLAPVAARVDAIPDHVGSLTAPSDVAIIYSEPSQRQSEDDSMDDESPEEVAQLIEDALSVEPSDIAMTGAPAASEPTFAAPTGHYEADLSSQLHPQASQDLSGQLQELFSEIDPRLFDPALFKDEQLPSPAPDADMATFQEALGFLAMVNFDMQEQELGPANYSEPPDTSAPSLFDPHAMSLDDFNATSRPQGFASLPYFPPPSRSSAAIQEGLSQRAESAVQAIAPSPNPVPPSPVVESLVGIKPNALFTFSMPATLMPATSVSTDPPLSAVQQGKRNAEPTVEAEGEGTSGVSTTPEELENEGSAEKTAEGQSRSHEIDPDHEIFNGDYTASDFDDHDDGSSISSMSPSEVAAYEAYRDGIEAAEVQRIDDELQARARRAGPGPSSSNTAPTERRIIAPKSKKNKNLT
ncbi:hypothetical protein MMC34_002851 [Xylographa carneopallida]|nr:hypothetical protein [Xylographa carneopallida]